MTNTLVGVYENRTQAQSAVDALVESGFSRTDVRMSTEGADSALTAGSGYDTTGHDTSGGIGGFFRALFGLNESDEDRRVSAYSQASDRGNCIVAVDTDDDEESRRAMEIMNRFDPIDLDEEGVADTTRADAGLGGMTGTAAASNTAQARSGGTLEGGASIPIVEEELKIGKRDVQRGGVRVYQRVHERPVQETLNLREEHVNVERRPVDKPASAADLNAFEEKSFEVRETAEEPVVSKSARVVEEVVINKDVDQRTETINDSVRRTDVDVERLGASGGTGTAGTTGTTGATGTTGMTGTTGIADNFGASHSSGPSVAKTTGVSGTSAAATYAMDQRDYSHYDEDYRSHWDTNYSNLSSTQGSYDDYAPAYRFGSDMADREHYRGRRFDDVEPTLRSDWESRHAGSSEHGTWDKVKDKVRYGWERMTR